MTWAQIFWCVVALADCWIIFDDECSIVFRIFAAMQLAQSTVKACGL